MEFLKFVTGTIFFGVLSAALYEWCKLKSPDLIFKLINKLSLNSDKYSYYLARSFVEINPNKRDAATAVMTVVRPEHDDFFERPYFTSEGIETKDHRVENGRIYRKAGLAQEKVYSCQLNSKYPAGFPVAFRSEEIQLNVFSEKSEYWTFSVDSFCQFMELSIAFPEGCAPLSSGAFLIDKQLTKISVEKHLTEHCHGNRTVLTLLIRRPKRGRKYQINWEW